MKERAAALRRETAAFLQVIGGEGDSLTLIRGCPHTLAFYNNARCLVLLAVHIKPLPTAVNRGIVWDQMWDRTPMGMLTAVSVRNAKPGRHADGEGLYLLVKPTGSRAWMLRIETEGRRRDIGLGSAKSVPLSEARDKARAIRKAVREGADPLNNRKSVPSVVPTFEEAAEACHEAMKDGWRNAKHSAPWLQTHRTYAFPTMANLSVELVGSPVI